MGMVGVLYGYIVRNLRKPKKDFCLSIGLGGMNVCGFNKDTYPWERTEVVGTSNRIIDDSH